MLHLFTFSFLFSCVSLFSLIFCFFFNDTATTEIYTLSLHDALPICSRRRPWSRRCRSPSWPPLRHRRRSEEHTSELQSLRHLVCRLLLEKKKEQNYKAVAHDATKHGQPSNITLSCSTRRHTRIMHHA